MHVLVDTNILIDYCFGKPYAVNFFEEAKREAYEIYILEDVYAETRCLVSDFHKVAQLFEQFIAAGLYHRIKTNKKLNQKTEALTKKCTLLIGHDLDRVDRKLIVLSLQQGHYILTKDKELRQIARTEGCHLLSL